MKNLKSIVVVTLLLIGTATMAQGPAHRQMRSATERAKMESEQMVKALDLKAGQTAQIQAINLKYAQKDSVSMVERRKNQSENVDREAMRKAMQAERDAKATEIKALLTDGQKAKYDEFLKENQRRGPRPEGQGGPGQRPEGGQPQENM
ncbi:MAG: hypothetical protein WC186_06605 [Bacteroidales bacterium]